MKLSKNIKNQEGVAHILVLVAAVGLIAFLLISNTFGFKDKLFNTLFPKPKSQAQEEQINNLPEFLSNQVLVKVKSSIKDKVKEGNPQDTGIDTLNQTFKQNNVKKFEKVAKAGKESKTDHELFNWYLVTLDFPQEKVVGKLSETSSLLQTKQNINDQGNNDKSYTLDFLQQTISKLKKDTNIEAVDLNYLVHTTAIPNDPYYSSTGAWGQTWDDLWGLKKINAAGAWDQTTGSASIVVAGIDTGVDRNHPDLAANMWVNSKETPKNGVDDDGNGFIDDYYGWNFVNNTGDPMDDMGHGTHTAGTIAAVGNNGVGVVGVNWTSKIMAVKFLDSAGSGDLNNGIKALQYAADTGARVSNNSWGCACVSSAMDDAIKYEHDKGMVVSIAAGNSHSDAIDFSPADADYAITVSATNHNDARASFSNYGEKIDVGAPGGDASSTGGIDDYILSLKSAVSPMCGTSNTIGTNYCIVRGTSMAAPHVAGLVALLLSKNPNLTNEEVRQILRLGSDDLGSVGKDKDFGYGRINALGSMNLVNTHPLTPMITSPSSRKIVGGTSTQITGSVAGPNFASYKLEAGLGRTPTSWITLNSSTTQVTTNGVLATVDTTILADGKYIFRLTATDTASKIYQFQVEDVGVDNFDAVVDYPAEAATLGIVDVMGSAATKNGVSFSNYKVDWALSSLPNSWSTNGITLVNNGSQPISKSKLGSWDTSNLTDGQSYILRLTVTATNGTATTYSITILIDKGIMVGWPQDLQMVPGGVGMVGPAGSLALVPVSNQMRLFSPFMPAGNGGVPYQNHIWVDQFRSDGTRVTGWPPLSASEAYPFTVPAVGDLDGDGAVEIVAGAIDNRFVLGGYQGTLFVLRPDSSMIWKKQLTGSYGGITIPVLEDLNGDGYLDIVAGSSNSNYNGAAPGGFLRAFDRFGNNLPGFPVTISGATWLPKNLAVADLDGDGKKEIAVVATMTDGTNKLFVYRSNGTLFLSTPLPSTGAYIGDPVIGDITGDGKPKIIAVTGDSAYGTTIRTITAWNPDGTIVSGWPVNTDNFSTYSISLGDLDGDGKPEVIANSGPRVSVFKGDGTSMTGWPKQIDRAANTFEKDPIIADIDGDGKPDIVVRKSIGGFYLDGTTNPPYEILRLYAYHADGTLISGYPKQLALPARYYFYYSYSGSDPVVGDFNSDGQLDLVAAGDHIYIAPDGLPRSGRIKAWTLATQTVGAVIEWGKERGDARNTGSYKAATVTPPPPSSPTPTPSPSPSPSPSETVPPTVSITSPANGSTITRNANFTITATATDNVAVARVEFYTDNSLKCTDTASAYTCTTKIAGKPGGTHTIIAKAYDTSGNTASSSITVKAQ